MDRSSLVWLPIQGVRCPTVDPPISRRDDPRPATFAILPRPALPSMPARQQAHPQRTHAVNRYGGRRGIAITSFARYY